MKPKDKFKPAEMHAVMEFWAWQQERGLPRKHEKRRIYSHEEILRGDWKEERDGEPKEDWRPEESAKRSH